MSSKILLIRILDANKFSQFVNVLSTVAHVKEDSNCHLIVSRTQLKLKILKNDANLCDVLVQFLSIFFDDYKYAQDDFIGHSFLFNNLHDITEVLEPLIKTVN